MTMLSFRVADSDARAATRWAAALGVDRSELLRDALRRHLAALAAERDVAAWQVQPLDEPERALGTASTWGPAEEWSDWTRAEG